jgi:hypothetical protein
MAGDGCQIRRKGMAFVIISLAKETLADGTCHIYSPNVPGFHVVDHDSKQAYKEAVPILIATLGDRVREAEVGDGVRWLEAPVVEVDDFVPGELRRNFHHHKAQWPDRMIFEIT